jgi:hypothetical protein
MSVSQPAPGPSSASSRLCSSNNESPQQQRCQ